MIIMSVLPFIVAELLAIHKPILVSHNLEGCDVQIESDCKVVVKALIGISECPC